MSKLNWFFYLPDCGDIKLQYDGPDIGMAIAEVEEVFERKWPFSIDMGGASPEPCTLWAMGNKDTYIHLTGLPNAVLEYDENTGGLKELRCE